MSQIEDTLKPELLQHVQFTVSSFGMKLGETHKLRPLCLKEKHVLLLTGSCHRAHLTSNFR